MGGLTLGFRADLPAVDVQVDKQIDKLRLSYKNSLGERDRVVYRWTGPLSNIYWHALHLRVNVHEGTFFTFETHSAGGIERHINYFRGDGEWKERVRGSSSSG
jgi:hypothetical protein